MNLTAFTDVAAFWKAAEVFLEAHEAQYAMIVGVLMDLRTQGGRDAGAALPRMILAEQEGQVTGLALETSRGLLLTAMPPGAVAALADLLKSQGASPGWGQGPLPAAEAFARGWTERTGQNANLHLSLGSHRLKRVIPPPAVSGTMRQATEADVELLTRWTDAYNRDIGHAPSDSAGYIRRHLARQAMFLWEHDGPVSMAACGGQTPHGIRLYCVYTPPEYRRRGYASALVAAVSQHLLDGGRRFCFLFTDLANPTTNHIYRAIGYEPLEVFAEYRFAKPGL